MELEFHINEGLNHFRLKEFNKSNYSIKHVTFSHPEFDIRLIKQSCSTKIDDKIHDVIINPLPTHYFSLYRDTYTKLDIESNIDGIITIQYEQNKPLYTKEELDEINNKQKIQTKLELEYYSKYYEILPTGNLLLKNLDNFEYYSEMDTKLYNLMKKNWKKQIITDKDKCILNRLGDIFTNIIVESDNDTVLHIISFSGEIKTIKINKGKYKYDIGYIIHTLCVYTKLEFIFDDNVKYVEIDYVILPETFRTYIIHYNGKVIGPNKEIIYSNGLCSNINSKSSPAL